MVDEPVAKLPLEAIPSQEGEISAIGSANAPFLYFESASAFGVLSGGIVRVTLEAERLIPVAESVKTDRIIVAHLRMNIPAAQSLKQALEKALLLVAPAANQQAS